MQNRLAPYVEYHDDIVSPSLAALAANEGWDLIDYIWESGDRGGGAFEFLNDDRYSPLDQSFVGLRWIGARDTYAEVVRRITGVSVDNLLVAAQELIKISGGSTSALVIYASFLAGTLRLHTDEDPRGDEGKYGQSYYYLTNNILHLGGGNRHLMFEDLSDRTLVEHDLPIGSAYSLLNTKIRHGVSNCGGSIALAVPTYTKLALRLDEC